MDNTRLFEDDEIKRAWIETTLNEVRDALREKGYDPVKQIVGYLVSGDPGYITNYKYAREQLLSLERSAIMDTIVAEYLGE